MFDYTQPPLQHQIVLLRHGVAQGCLSFFENGEKGEKEHPVVSLTIVRTVCID